ncbi:Protein of unknown function [Bacillus sp. UNCCL13]|nr:Protein of unknown function [Bacillus sp. UNCCL13]
MLGMAASAVTLGMVTRVDVVALETVVFQQNPLCREWRWTEVLRKSPALPGFFGEKRSLSTIEITHLFNNVQTNAIGKTLIIGFAQVAEKEEVVNFLLRGKAIAQKHVDVFSKILTENDLPAPMLWDAAVTDSRDRVFSDKLIMFHVTAMIAAGIGNYGGAMAASPRRDIAMKYATYIPEYAEDGANIMIKHGWLEEPPLADNRNKLARE